MRFHFFLRRGHYLRRMTSNWSRSQLLQWSAITLGAALKVLAALSLQADTPNPIGTAICCCCWLDIPAVRKPFQLAALLAAAGQTYLTLLFS